MMERLIKAREVEELTSVNKRTFNRWVDQGTFPIPVRLSERRIAWVLSEVMDWIEQQKQNKF